MRLHNVKAARARHADPGTRTGQQEDEDRAALNVRARRQPFGLGAGGCGVVCLLAQRKGIHPQTHLAGFECILQADAYGDFNELYESGKIREAAC